MTYSYSALAIVPFDPLIHSTPQKHRVHLMDQEFQYQVDARMNELMREMNRGILEWFRVIDPIIHSLAWVRSQQPTRHEWIEDSVR